jgi:hypothetical protein
VITIHAGDRRQERFTQDVTGTAPLVRLAQEWSYILRARSRWADDAEQRKSFGARALDDLKRVGVPRSFIQQVALAERIEVELHDWDRNDPRADKIHEAAAEVPWEYLISAATRAEGRFGSLLISRLLHNETPAVTPAAPRDVLFVESAPGRLGEIYEFGDEEARIRAAVGGGKRMAILNTPQLSELRQKVEGAKWEAIHVTGIDTHQAAWEVEDFYKDYDDSTKANAKSFDPKKKRIWEEITVDSERLCDGMILREDHISELPVRYDRLAAALVAVPPPRIVTLNLYYSGARTARELVRAGAHVALGFLDEIDDELAELFFQAFYWRWCHTKPAPSISDAFCHAWEQMRGDGLHGTSIVIWMGRSVFETDGAARKSRSAARTKEVAT